MVLVFYGDLVSQPCRSVYLFLKETGIDFKFEFVDLYQAEQMSPSFLKMNPDHKIPLIDDDGFILSESIPIMNYLAVKYDVDDHWFPRADLKQQTRVNEFLHWQSFGIRKPAIEVFLPTIKSTLTLGKIPMEPPLNEEVKNKARDELKRGVQHLDEYFLKDKPFIAGSDISVADIVCVSELMQIDGVLEEALYLSNKNVAALVQRVKDRLQKYFGESTERLMTLRDRFVAVNK